MTLASSLSLAAISAMMVLLAMLQSPSSVQAMPSPEPVTLTSTAIEHQQQTSASDNYLLPDVSSASTISSAAMDNDFPSHSPQQQQQQKVITPPLPKLASPLEVTSYASDPNQAMLQQQLLSERLQMRPVDYLPLMPGIRLPAPRVDLPKNPQNPQNVGNRPAKRTDKDKTLSEGVEKRSDADDGISEGNETAEKRAAEPTARPFSSSTMASPEIDPDMTCFLDFNKPGVVLCSNGKTYAYYDPKMEGAGPQRPPLKRASTSAPVYPMSVMYGDPAQPFQPRPITQYIPGSGTTTTRLPKRVSYPSSYFSGYSRSPAGLSGTDTWPGSYNPSPPRNTWASPTDGYSSGMKLTKRDDWSKGGWNKRSLNTDFAATTDGSASPTYQVPASSSYATDYLANDLTTLQQQQQQSLQQQQLALQMQQQAALIRSQLVQNLIATQPQGVVSPSRASTFTPLQKRQAPAAAIARPSGFGRPLGGSPSAAAYRGANAGFGMNVIPVPIDISLLAEPDGDLTLLPPDFDPSLLDSVYGDYGRS